MGSASDQGISTEWPQHIVEVEPFQMGKYPVTQQEWRFGASLPKVRYELNPEPSRFKSSDTLPVESIDWHEATEYCKRLSIYTGENYQLPREAQWEYACRAGTTTPFNLGDKITADLVNYNGYLTCGSRDIVRKITTSVGQLPNENAFGLYDMHGNVWEWCMDVWYEDYDKTPGHVYCGTEAVIRGGCWNSESKICRSAARNYLNFYSANSYVGFRVAIKYGVTNA